MNDRCVVARRSARTATVWPGSRAATIAWTLGHRRSPCGRRSTRPRSPLLSPGVRRRAPRRSRRGRDAARRRTVAPLTPRYASLTWPPRSSRGRNSLAVSIGTANAIPTLPVPPSPPVSICELIPITRPVASSSGPPELPGLIGASVWITLSMLNPFGRLDLTLERRHDPARQRPVEAERVADRERRIADPDRRSSRRAGADGHCGTPLMSTFSSARSLSGSCPDDGRRPADVVLELRRSRRSAVRALDHVVVGEDPALAVDQEARPGRDAALLLRETGRTGPGPARSPGRARTRRRGRRGRRSRAASGRTSCSRRAGPRPAPPRRSSSCRGGR